MKGENQYTKMSIYQKQKLEALKKAAFELYKQGFSTREVAQHIGRSHTWVAKVVKELDGKKKK